MFTDSIVMILKNNEVISILAKNCPANVYRFYCNDS